MDFDQKKAEAQRRITDVLHLQAAKRKDTYICPLCGNGSGKEGDGITSKDGMHYKCFVCGHYGDVFDWVKAVNQIEDDKEAFKRVFEALGMKGNDYTPTERKAEPNKTTEKPATDYSVFYLQAEKELQETPEALEYLHKRGLSDEIIKRFRLGYCRSWTHPENQSGKPSKRIIIPVTKSSYTARAIDTDGKYKVMKAGKSRLYNVKALSGSKPVFVVEGEIDALSVIQAGGEAVALGSTANYKALIDKVQAGEVKAPLILCMDNDEAGREAAERLKNGLTAAGYSFTLADINGSYKDANEALQHDAQTLEKIIATTAAKFTQETPTRGTMADYLEECFINDVESYAKYKNVKTGFRNLDEKLGALIPGLYVIGAGSGIGKTTFALQIADYLAAHGEEVLYFTLEQSRFELASKSIARIRAQKDRTNAPTAVEIRLNGITDETTRQAFQEYAQTIAPHITIFESAFDMNIAQIKADVENFIKTTNKKPVVFIDYMQIIPPTDPRQSDKEKADVIIRELKKLQKENKIIVFAISSINRANYLLPIGEESFKESGGIEYTADAVLGLQYAAINAADKKTDAERREILNTAREQNPRSLELVILKNRTNLPGVKVYFTYYSANDLFLQETTRDGGARAAKRL